MASKKNADLRLSGILVLVFDADKAARDTLKANLEVCGAIVSVARSPRELLAILAQFSPHVIVADLSTAGEDWYGLLNEARNSCLRAGRSRRSLSLPARPATIEHRRTTPHFRRPCQNLSN